MIILQREQKESKKKRKRRESVGLVRVIRSARAIKNLSLWTHWTIWKTLATCCWILQYSRIVMTQRWQAPLCHDYFRIGDRSLISPKRSITCPCDLRSPIVVKRMPGATSSATAIGVLPLRRPVPHALFALALLSKSDQSDQGDRLIHWFYP